MRLQELNKTDVSYEDWKEIVHIELNKIYNQDCLVGMRGIEDKSIDMILCDLPYGQTARNK
jgi:DNA modification methylase